MRVLLVGEASGVHRNLKKGLVKHGVEATLIMQSASTSWKWYDDTFAPDLLGALGGIARNVSPFLKIAGLPKYDVINMINTITAVHGTYTKYFDLPLLRRKAGILSYYALGCDEIGLIRRSETLPYRPCETCLASGEMLGRDCERYYNPRYERSRELVRKNFDFGASSMIEYAHCGDLFPIFWPIRLPVDVDPIAFEPAKSRDRVRIVHTPTRRGFKGTDVVVDAIQMLTLKRTDFEFQIVEGLDYASYLAAISDADIVIDQVHSQSSGMNGLELLAAGKIVLTGATELGEQYFPDGVRTPAFDASPDPKALAATLSGVLDRKDEFADLAMKGRTYVETYHNPELIAEKFLAGWRETSRDKIRQ